MAFKIIQNGFCLKWLIRNDWAVQNQSLASVTVRCVNMRASKVLEKALSHGRGFFCEIVKWQVWIWTFPEKFLKAFEALYQNFPVTYTSLTCFFGDVLLQSVKRCLVVLFGQNYPLKTLPSFLSNWKRVLKMRLRLAEAQPEVPSARVVPEK